MPRIPYKLAFRSSVGSLTTLSHVRAPSGYTKEKPLVVGGKQFVGGEFIPSDVLAQASHEQRAGLIIHDAAHEPQGEAAKVSRAEEDYKKLGTRSHAFKAWFGDWEHDPANASKVVNEEGEPQETHDIPGTGSKVKDKEGKPIVVYHGTANARFDEFDKSKLAADSLYGRGFYFTEDEAIAEEYQEKGRIDRGIAAYRLKDRPEVIAARATQWLTEHPDEQNAEDDEILRKRLAAFGSDPDKVKKALYHNFPESFTKELMEIDPNETHKFSVFLNIRKPFDIDNDKLTGRQLGLKQIYPDELKDYVLERFVKKDNKATLDTPLPFDFWSAYAHATGAIGDVDEHGDKVENVANQINETIKRLGYDGLTHIGGDRMGGGHHHRVWIAFEPEQIKAKGNRGTFDPNSKNITLSLGHFDEQKHPRGHEGNKGQFRRKDEGAGAESHEDRAQRVIREELARQEREEASAPESHEQRADRVIQEELAKQEGPDLHALTSEWYHDPRNRRVSPLKRTEIVNALQMTFSAISPTLRKKAIANMERPPQFYESVRDVTNEADRLAGIQPGTRGAMVGGWFSLDRGDGGKLTGRGQLHLDFSDPILKKMSPTLADEHTGVIFLYAHELAHAADGADEYSGDPEWRAAYAAELNKPGAPLTKNALLADYEGFADYIATCVVAPNEAEDRFPKCWEFCKARGLV